MDKEFRAPFSLILDISTQADLECEGEYTTPLGTVIAWTKHFPPGASGPVVDFIVSSETKREKAPAEAAEAPVRFDDLPIAFRNKPRGCSQDAKVQVVPTPLGSVISDSLGKPPVTPSFGQVEPVSPREIRANNPKIPDIVILVVNALLQKNYLPEGIIISVNELVDLLVSDGLLRNDVYEKGWLNFESVFQKQGWTVVFKNEGSKSYWIFK